MNIVVRNLWDAYVAEQFKEENYTYEDSCKEAQLLNKFSHSLKLEVNKLLFLSGKPENGNDD